MNSCAQRLNAGLLVERRRVTLLVALFLLMFLACLPPLFADDSPTYNQPPLGHQVEASPFFPGEVYTKTEIPSRLNKLGALSPRRPAALPARDDGIGQLRWLSLDQNGICERVALSADGRWAAVGYSLNDERLEVRNAQDGDTVFTFPVEYGPGWVDISADGMVIAYAALDSVWLFRRDQGRRPVFRFGMNGFAPGPLALNRDGTRLVATGNDPERRVNRAWGFRVGEAQPIWSFEADAEESFVWMGAAIVEDDPGRVILTAKFQMYALTDGQLTWQEPTYNSESAAVVSESGEMLALGSLYGRLRVFYRTDDGDGYQEMWHYSFRAQLGSWVTATAISPDGRYIAAGTLDFFDDQEVPFQGRLALFDAFGDGSPLWVAQPLRDEIAGIAFSRHGGVVAAVTWGDVDNETPDLVLHELHNPQPFFSLNTPGSLSGVGISDDGATVLAGGKSVHNRVFGRGGWLFCVSARYPGALVTGVVRIQNNQPLVNLEIYAEDNPYLAALDDLGRYRLRVEAQGDRRVNIVVRGKGITTDRRENVLVRRGQTTEGIDFNLTPAGPPPRGLTATQDVRNAVVLRWEPYNQRRTPIISGVPLRSAQNGNSLSPVSLLTPWDIERRAPTRDETSEAEQILIYRTAYPHQAGGRMQLIGSAEGDAGLFVDRQRVFPQRNYHYAITADFGDGESGYSNLVSGAVNEDFLIWSARLEPMNAPPRIDGEVGDEEWRGAVHRDISDVYGYDEPDSAGTVSVKVGFSDDTDRLYLAFDYHTYPRLTNRMGVGVYVDDDADGRWNYSAPASEGNYWGYWIDGAPQLYYRSLSGPPFTGPPTWPYREFPAGLLAFNDRRGRVQLEMAIPIGFHVPEEIAVYQPDRTIGLGLFAMHRDRDENAVFDGWWPQDVVSIVSNPYQFARVHIPVNLTVPPQAPMDVRLNRRGAAIELSWRDPALGMDNGELRGLAGIVVERNSDSLTTLRPGALSHLDNRVIAGGWYQYRLRGFVLENGSPFYGPWSQAVGMYAGSEPAVEVLRLDDDSAESYFVVGFQGEDNRFGTRFELDLLRDTIAVYWIDFYTSTPDEINVYIAGEEAFLPSDPLGGIYRVKPSQRDGWNRFHFPGVQQPRIAILPFAFNACWACLQYLPNSPGAPGIGVDESRQSPGANKYFTRANNDWRAFNYGQLMVRIAVGRPVAGVPNDPTPVPQKFSVNPVFPNPFNGRAFLPVSLPSASVMRMTVLDGQGRFVSLSELGFFPAGDHFIPLDFSKQAAGVYFIDVHTGSGRNTRQVIFCK